MQKRLQARRLHHNTTIARRRRGPIACARPTSSREVVADVAGNHEALQPDRAGIVQSLKRDKHAADVERAAVERLDQPAEAQLVRFFPVGAVDADGHQIRAGFFQPQFQVLGVIHPEKVAQVETDAQVLAVDLLRQPHGVFDPLDVASFVRIERNAEAGAGRHVGDFAEDRYGPIVEAVAGGLAAHHGNPDQGVAALELLDGRPKPGIVRRFLRIDPHGEVNAEHLQAHRVEVLEHFGDLLDSVETNAVVAQFLEHLGLLVERDAAAARAVVEGKKGIGQLRLCGGGVVG